MEMALTGARMSKMATNHLFESPRRLNLQIRCTYIIGTPARKNLGIWPAFPIFIDGLWIMPICEDNVIATLQHPDRVSFVRLHVTGSQLANMATVMQEPFPMLKHLHISSRDGNAPVLPAEFLGGSAPCLQAIHLDGIPFPASPTLLLSTSHLVDLLLRDIPPSGYISPEAMVAGLAALPRLKTFIIEFQSVTPHPDRIRPPHVKRTVLPALTVFRFKGASEYLEDIVARINSPQLDQIDINYVNRLVDFPVAQLSKFVDCSIGPKLSQFRHWRVRVTFFDTHISFDVYHPNRPGHRGRNIISCEGINWHVSDIAQVFSRFSATLFNVVHLELEEVEAEPFEYLGNTDDVEWLHLFHQLSTVRTLYVSEELAEYVALALEGITGEMVTEVLPSIDLICLASQSASSVGKFVAARRLFDRTVTVVDTQTEFDERLESYISE
jgi:hypothetical protein